MRGSDLLVVSQAGLHGLLQTVTPIQAVHCPRQVQLGIAAQQQGYTGCTYTHTHTHTHAHTHCGVTRGRVVEGRYVSFQEWLSCHKMADGKTTSPRMHHADRCTHTRTHTAFETEEDDGLQEVLPEIP